MFRYETLTHTSIEENKTKNYGYLINYRQFILRRRSYHFHLWIHHFISQNEEENITKNELY